MKSNSLKEAINVIINALENSNMEQIDKVELELNLYKFLESYDKNIKVLQKVKNEINSSSK